MATPLERVAWTLAAATDLGVDHSDVDVTARFADGTVSGRSGCNHYSGPYVIDDHSLTIGPHLVSTMMACPDPAMAVEAAYLRLLPTVVACSIEGNTLTLTDATATLILVFDHLPAEQALAGSWSIVAVRAADAVASTLPGTELTLTFDGGRAAGHAGVNRFHGAYTASGERLTFGALATTRMAAIDPAVGRQERDLLAALAATATFSATRRQLALLAADGTITVTLVRDAGA